MNWLSRLLPGSGPALNPEQQTALDSIAALPAPDPGRSHYETRYVVVNTETGPMEGGGQRLLAVGAVALNQGLLHPGDAYRARLGSAPVNALIGLIRFIARAPVIVFKRALQPGHPRTGLRAQPGQPARARVDRPDGVDAQPLPGADRRAGPNGRLAGRLRYRPAGPPGMRCSKPCA
jgi:DNA polymerase-3 subunit epsilon